MNRHVLPTLILAALFPFACAVAHVAEPQGLSDALRPAGEQAAFVLQAEGVQVYACKRKRDLERDLDTHAWALVAPEAKLLENGKVVGKHYAGPYWEVDGSKVKGAVKQRQEAGEGNIPWLLLSGSAEGAGRFAGVTSITRVATRGGVEPKGGCEASKVGQEQRVPYTADYYFYRRK